jgi:hypothetical protein
MIIRPTVQDVQVLAFDETRFLQPTQQTTRLIFTQFGWSAAEDADQGQRWLLSPSNPWPCGRRAAQKCNELPTPRAFLKFQS